MRHRIAWKEDMVTSCRMSASKHLYRYNFFHTCSPRATPEGFAFQLQDIAGLELREMCEDLRIERHIHGPDTHVGHAAGNLLPGLYCRSGDLQVGTFLKRRGYNIYIECGI